MTIMSTSPQRWSIATVYPDMWVDPDDDPRSSDRHSPDGELATLLSYLRDYRLTLDLKCQGLTLEQMMKLTVPPSTMSLFGLVRQMTEVERDWRNWITDGEPEPRSMGAWTTHSTSVMFRLTPRKPSSPMPSPDWNRSRPPPTPKSADTTTSAHTWAEKTSRCGNS